MSFPLRYTKRNKKNIYIDKDESIYTCKNKTSQSDQYLLYKIKRIKDRLGNQQGKERKH